MLTKVRKLVEELNANGVRYCHWKSNFSLAQALSGQTDVDLLVHRRDAVLFRKILSQLCFRPAIIKDGEPFPSVEHYFALDEESGILAHVHAYFRVITGESLAKNYRFPLEEMLLQNTRKVDSVAVPTKSAELVVFTLRMMLKHTSLVELLLLARDRKGMQREIEWLLDIGSIDETLTLVNYWLPFLDAGLFSGCVAALSRRAPLVRRVVLAWQLRSQLQLCARQSAMRAWLSGVQKFARMFLRRVTRGPRGMVPLSGGVVIAFVGPEATGKSTLLAEMSRWLSEHFAVEQVHAGKPRPTLLTAAPNLLVPALRARFPAYRSSHVETRYASAAPRDETKKVYPLVFGLRSVLLAYDRRSLLIRAFRRATNGTVVLCDRYPSLQSGATDSPQLLHLPIVPGRHPIRHLLARTEKRLYGQIPPPDLVISLCVPIEVAIERNETRGKKEPEDYVRRRHAQSLNLEFGNTPVYRINTDQPLAQTVLEVKRAIWDIL